MVHDSSSDAGRQATSLLERKTCGKDRPWQIDLINAKSNIQQTVIFMLVFLPPYICQYLSFSAFTCFFQLGRFGAVTHTTWYIQQHKQTEQEPFVYWWQMPTCFTFSLSRWQIRRAIIESRTSSLNAVLLFFTVARLSTTMFLFYKHSKNPKIYQKYIKCRESCLHLD